MNYEDLKIRILVIRRKLLMDYAEIKNLMRDMENSSLDSIEIALPEGTKVKMRKSPIIYAGLNYDVTENSTSQGVNKVKNIAVSENIEND